MGRVSQALGVLGRLQHRQGLRLSPAELGSFAAPLVRQSLRWCCPSDAEAAEQLVRQREGRPVAAEGSPLSLLATELIPRWLEEEKHARGDRPGVWELNLDTFF